ncbi:MAG: Branched-chain-amino-acid aminotransferase [Microgenomates bacterium OLB22]|nr:MAG: Branched-chain-amino-acid aminotransferase [Microgenomates bacterium OLB22]
MNAASKVWINGEIKDSAEVSFFPFNQAINYGATVYEGIRMYDTKSGPALFRLDEHLDRLAYSAQTLRMQTKWKKADLKQAIIDTVIANELKSGYIRPLLFYSEQKMGINILGSEVTSLILTWPWEDRTESKKSYVEHFYL